MLLCFYPLNYCHVELLELGVGSEAKLIDQPKIRNNMKESNQLSNEKKILI